MNMYNTVEFSVQIVIIRNGHSRDLVKMGTSRFPRVRAGLNLKYWLNDSTSHTAVTHDPKITRIPKDQEKLKKILRSGQIPPNHAGRKVLIDVLWIGFNVYKLNTTYTTIKRIHQRWTLGYRLIIWKERKKKVVYLTCEVQCWPCLLNKHPVKSTSAVHSTKPTFPTLYSTQKASTSETSSCVLCSTTSAK